MTTTRISKIARLPHPLREQLNRRLQNGEMGRTLVKWLNEQPETKTVMADLFDGNLITHQNLSDWRRTGYQDWLLHQQRIQWFQTLTEHETEIDKHDQCNDTFEAMSNYFIFELGQAITSLQSIKNSHDRLNRLETLTREFARLQNAFNWSRRVQLEFAKFNAPNEPEESKIEALPENVIEVQTQPAPTKLESPSSREPDSKLPTPISDLPITTSDPKRQRAGALQDAPRTPEAQDQRANVVDSDSPLPLSNPLPIKESQPIPAPAPTTPPAYQFTPRFLQEINKIRKTKHLHPPMRGRRFVCVEG